jgi:hypothetical protein
MNQYAVRRPQFWADPDTLAASAATSAKVDDDLAAHVRWIRSYVVREELGELGTVCIYEATSREMIREHAQRVGMPVDEILPVVDTVIVRPDPFATSPDRGRSSADEVTEVPIP